MEREPTWSYYVRGAALVLPPRVESVYRWDRGRWEQWNPRTKDWDHVTGLHREGLERAIYLGSDAYLDEVPEQDAMAAARALGG